MLYADVSYTSEFQKIDHKICCYFFAETFGDPHNNEHGSRFLRMTLEEKRRLYNCGKYFKELKHLVMWPAIWESKKHYIKVKGINSKLCYWLLLFVCVVNEAKNFDGINWVAGLLWVNTKGFHSIHPWPSGCRPIGNGGPGGLKPPYNFQR